MNVNFFMSHTKKTGGAPFFLTGTFDLGGCETGAKVIVPFIIGVAVGAELVLTNEIYFKLVS
jgi:hypothetical protein